MSGPFFVIEDIRSLFEEDRATELDCLGSWYTWRDLNHWRGMDAQVICYDGDRREHVGAVDDILDGTIRPGLEAAA